jgi:hypothetical protein
MSHIEKDHLDETRKKLVNEITLLSYDEFNSSPGMEKWSIAQVCHHLVLVEKVSLKVIGWGLKEMGHTQKERKKVDVMLDRTKKLKAPKIVDPSVEPFEVQQIINLFSESRSELTAFLSTIEDKSVLAEKSFKHPAFGELPLDQWIEHIYLHEQRHIEQIKEIKSLLNVSH